MLLESLSTAFRILESSKFVKLDTFSVLFVDTENYRLLFLCNLNRFLSVFKLFVCDTRSINIWFSLLFR